MTYGTPSSQENSGEDVYEITIKVASHDNSGDNHLFLRASVSVEYPVEGQRQDDIFQTIVDALDGHPYISYMYASKTYPTVEEITPTS